MPKCVFITCDEQGTPCDECSPDSLTRHSRIGRDYCETHWPLHRRFVHLDMSIDIERAALIADWVKAHA